MYRSNRVHVIFMNDTKEMIEETSNTTVPTCIDSDCFITFTNSSSCVMIISYIRIEKNIHSILELELGLKMRIPHYVSGCISQSIYIYISQHT